MANRAVHPTGQAHRHIPYYRRPRPFDEHCLEEKVSLIRKHKKFLLDLVQEHGSDTARLASRHAAQHKTLLGRLEEQLRHAPIAEFGRLIEENTHNIEQMQLQNERHRQQVDNLFQQRFNLLHEQLKQQANELERQQRERRETLLSCLNQRLGMDLEEHELVEWNREDREYLELEAGVHQEEKRFMQLLHQRQKDQQRAEQQPELRTIFGQYPI